MSCVNNTFGTVFTQLELLKCVILSMIFLVLINYIELELSEKINTGSPSPTLGTIEFKEIYNTINMTRTNTYSNNLTITRSSDTDVYLLSAVIIRAEDRHYSTDYKQYGIINNLTVDVIVINSWQRGNVTSRVFKCCFLLTNNTVVEFQSSTKQMYCYAELRAIQYECPSQVEIDLIKMVSVVTGNKKCHGDSTSYIKLEIGYKGHHTDLAVCTKLTYDSVNAASLVEWFEAQRLLGVDKVITYPLRLDANANAKKVLKYYEAVGFLEVINGLYLPEQGK